MDFTEDILSIANVDNAPQKVAQKRKKKTPEKNPLEKKGSENKKKKTSPPAEESSILKTFPSPKVPKPPALESELEKVVVRLVDKHFCKFLCHACKKH